MRKVCLSCLLAIRTHCVCHVAARIFKYHRAGKYSTNTKHQTPTPTPPAARQRRYEVFKPHCQPTTNGNIILLDHNSTASRYACCHCRSSPQLIMSAQKKNDAPRGSRKRRRLETPPYVNASVSDDNDHQSAMDALDKALTMLLEDSDENQSMHMHQVRNISRLFSLVDFLEPASIFFSTAHQ